jgi:glutaredoxin
MRRLLVVCLALASLAAAAETYRWTDPTGRTVISDTAPPGRARDVAKTANGNGDSEEMPYALRKAVDSYPVTLYTSAECLAECKQARELLNGRGVPFTEKMVQSEDDVATLKKLFGDAFVPALTVGKQSFRGYSASAYDNLLDLAGYPKTAPYGSKPAGGLAK